MNQNTAPDYPEDNVSPTKFPGKWEWIGIACEGEKIALAHVIGGVTRRPRVLQLISTTIKIDSDQISNSYAVALARFKEARKLISSIQGKQIVKVPCSFILENVDYEVLTPEEPDVKNVGAIQKRQALRWALQGLVSFPMDRASLDVLISGTLGRPQSMVIAASESVVATLMRASLEARVNLQAIDVPEASQRNLAHLAEQGSNVIAMLVFSKHRVLLTISAKGELLMTRKLENIDAEKLENDEVARDRFCSEVERTLNNFKRQNGGDGVDGIDELLLATNSLAASSVACKPLIQKFEQMGALMLPKKFSVNTLTTSRMTQLVDVEDERLVSSLGSLDLLAIGAACRGSELAKV